MFKDRFSEELATEKQKASIRIQEEVKKFTSEYISQEVKKAFSSLDLREMVKKEFEFLNLGEVTTTAVQPKKKRGRKKIVVSAVDQEVLPSITHEETLGLPLPENVSSREVEELFDEDEDDEEVFTEKLSEEDLLELTSGLQEKYSTLDELVYDIMKSVGKNGIDLNAISLRVHYLKERGVYHSKARKISKCVQQAIFRLKKAQFVYAEKLPNHKHKMYFVRS